MPTQNMLRYKYSFANENKHDVISRMNAMFSGKFEIVDNDDKFTKDQYKLVFLNCEESEQMQIWRDLVESHRNGDINAQHLIEVVRQEANDQYDELKMAFVKHIHKGDIPCECDRCNTQAPSFDDMKGIYPSFASKVQWFNSEEHKWSLAMELIDHNIAGFDPLYDHPENDLFHHPEIVIFRLVCPQCLEESSKAFQELLDNI